MHIHLLADIASDLLSAASALQHNLLDMHPPAICMETAGHGRDDPRSLIVVVQRTKELSVKRSEILW